MTNNKLIKIDTLSNRCLTIESRLNKIEESIGQLSIILTQFTDQYNSFVKDITTRILNQDNINSKLISLYDYFLKNTILKSGVEPAISEVAPIIEDVAPANLEDK